MPCDLEDLSGWLWPLAPPDEDDEGQPADATLESALHLVRTVLAADQR